MFLGALPPLVCSALSKIVFSSGFRNVYVGCSGNFTIERALLKKNSGLSICSNDVSMYSCVLGDYLSKRDLTSLVLKSEFPERLSFVRDNFENFDASEKLSCFLLCEEVASFLSGSNARRFYEDYVLTEFVGGFARRLETLCARLKKMSAKVKHFYPEDVFNFLERVPSDGVFLCFPPFWSGGYERMFKILCRWFDYPVPDYILFDECRKKEFAAKVLTMKNFACCFDEPLLPSDLLIGNFVTAGGKIIYFYSRVHNKFYVGLKDRKGDDCCLSYPLEADFEELPGADVRFVKIQKPWFERAYFAHFATSRVFIDGGQYYFAFVSDGKIYAYAAFARDARLNCSSDFERPTVCLITHFVVPSACKRLSRLLLMCVRTGEMQHLLARCLGYRPATIFTVAFSEHFEVMQYRGTGFSRIKITKEGERHKYIYVANFADFSVREAFEKWKQKF